MSFGALTDHFGILAITNGGGTLTDNLVLVASSNTPDAQSRGEARDENGDVAAASWYGNTAKALEDASSTFALVSGSFNLNLLKCGELSTGVVVTSIEVGTDNQGWPRIKVNGKLGAEAIVAPTGLLNTYTLPSVTLTAIKAAQPMVYTVSDGKLTSSNLTATVELAQQEDGVGEPAAHGISGGILTATANLVRITDAPSGSWAVGWTETQAPGLDEGQAAYHTSRASAEKILARDVGP